MSHVPAFFGGNKLFVEEDAGGAPHIGHGIVLGLAFRLRGLVQLVADVGRHVGDVVRCAGRSCGRVGSRRSLRKHAFDDVLRGAYDVEVLVPALNFGEHDFVDIEHLVDDTEVFARLLLVPVGKFGKHISSM